MQLIPSFVQLFNNPLVVAVVNLISFIGFIVTIFVAIKVSNINRHYQFIGREDLRSKLANHASSISQYLSSYDDNAILIIEEITIAQVTVRSLMV